MKFTKIVETCIYSTKLKEMENFYINNLGLEFVSEENGRHVFLKAGKSMLLIFNPESTLNDSNSIFPVHGAITPPSIVHFAQEINIEKELKIGNSKSIYFRDPSGNVVELITANAWPVDN